MSEAYDAKSEIIEKESNFREIIENDTYPNDLQNFFQTQIHYFHQNFIHT